MTARGYATGHGDTIEDMLGELEAQALERGRWPITTWRGRCGHVWDRAIEDTPECPRCAERAAVAAKAREWAAHYPEASDGRNTFVLFAEWAEELPPLPEAPR